MCGVVYPHFRDSWQMSADLVIQDFHTPFVHGSLSLFFSKSSTSSMDSGSLQFKVSGNMKESNPPKSIVEPKMNGVIQVLTDDRLAINGATMEPILANVEEDPKPILRTTVGKISPA